MSLSGRKSSAVIHSAYPAISVGSGASALAGNEIVVTFGDVEGGDQRGSAKWEASYVFPRTGLHVDNKISASFEFDKKRRAVSSVHHG